MRLLTFFATLLIAPQAWAVTAFPGAEGFGANAVGGRGGDVYIVDSLADSGPGTLRECAEASGPRTCVFATGGTINLETAIWVRDGHLTIAGQTAPGGGIAIGDALSNESPFYIVAPHVIVRHIRVRPGPSELEASSINCFQVGSENIILDHVSCSWATDQLLATWNVGLEGTTAEGLVTIQDSLFYEALSHSTHSKGEHSKGPLFRGCGPGVSVIRTLIAHNEDRNPNVTCAGHVELVNNVIYDPGRWITIIYDGRGKPTVAAVRNWYGYGPDTHPNSRYSPYGIDHPDSLGPDEPEIYLEGNIGEGMPADAIHEVLEPNDASLVVSGPSVPLHSSVMADGWFNVVLNESGAWPRDASDARVVQTVRDRTGAIIDHPSEVGGWPVLAAGTPPTDSDADGMADSWEEERGLNSSDPADRNGDDDGDGYTNLEEYLSELAGDPQGQNPEMWVELSWDASSDPDGTVSHYIVRRDGTEIAQPTATTYADTQVVWDTTYSYTVEAVDDQGAPSGETQAVSVTTPTETEPASNQPPSTPTGLTATVVTGT